MKLANMTVNQFKMKKISGLGIALVSSLLVSCANMNTGGDIDEATSMEPQVEVSKQPENVEHAGSTQADSLMASLAAPVEEPGTAPEPVVKSKVKSKAKQAVVTKVEKTIKSNAADKKGLASTVNTKSEMGKMKPKTAKAKSKTAKAKSKAAAKPLNFTLNDLPANYDIWTIKEGETPLTQGLVISTPTWEMGKEGYVSQIWLTLMDDRIHINSSSDIAPEASGLGIKIDDGALIPFSHIAENNIGVVEGAWLDKLATANNLEIYLGFFPGKKPSSETFKSATSLENLDRIVATYHKLRK